MRLHHPPSEGLPAAQLLLHVDLGVVPQAQSFFIPCPAVLSVSVCSCICFNVNAITFFSFEKEYTSSKFQYKYKSPFLCIVAIELEVSWWAWRNPSCSRVPRGHAAPGWNARKAGAGGPPPLTRGLFDFHFS